jgi:hypothetical protein
MSKNNSHFKLTSSRLSNKVKMLSTIFRCNYGEIYDYAPIHYMHVRFTFIRIIQRTKCQFPCTIYLHLHRIKKYILLA